MNEISDSAQVEPGASAADVPCSNGLFLEFSNHMETGNFDSRRTGVITSELACEFAAAILFEHFASGFHRIQTQ